MANLIALYDACVLFPAPLRDLLMQLALTGLFRAKWSHDIHEEWIRNVLRTRTDLTRKQLDHVRELMDQCASDALVEGYEPLIPSLNLPDKNDRHILAAAITSSASVIVTFNLKDFPPSVLDQYGIEARHPDEFIKHLLEIDPATVCTAVKLCRKRLKNPPFDVDRYLNNLVRQSLLATAAKLREFNQLI